MKAEATGVQFLFSSYYHVREEGYALRQNSRLNVPMARTDIGQSSCKMKGTRLWNNCMHALLYSYLSVPCFTKLYLNIRLADIESLILRMYCTRYI